MTLHVVRRTAHHVLAVMLGLTLATGLAVAGAGAAEAAPRPVPIRGTQPKPQVFFIKGVIGPDFAGRKVVVQRKANPRATWHKWKKVKTSKIGKYKVRVVRVRGSRQTCYRVRVHAYGGYEKGTSRVKCLVRVR